MKPKIGCLFWFYKNPSLCENRLRIFRSFNPSTPIYGLYGGPTGAAEEFETRLAPYLQDFYAFRDVQEERWKWRHGDRMIAQWFVDRGHLLKWDSIFVLQWDMLVFDRLDRQFPNLRKGELMMSGLRPVSEVAPWWSHLRSGTGREEYERFITFVRREHRFDGQPMCGLFVVVCLPREFLARYYEIPSPELGFLEYKVPVYAQIFGTPLHRSRQHEPWWDDDPLESSVSIFSRSLNAGKQEVPLRIIESHRALPSGRRIFHPVFQPYPLSLGERFCQTARDIYEHEVRRRWWRFNRQYLDHD